MQYARIDNGQIVEGPKTIRSPRLVLQGDEWGWITGGLGWSVEQHISSGWLPVEREPLGENQAYGAPIVEAQRVFVPAVDEQDAEIAERNLREAMIVRDEAEEAPIQVFGPYWDVSDKGRVRMKEAIDTAIRKNYPSEATVPWLSANGEQHEVTRTALEAILDAVSDRRLAIWQQYNAWVAGDRLVPFTFSE